MIAAMRRPWFVLLAGILLLAAVLSAVAVSGALPGRSSPAQTDAGRLLQGLDDLRVQAFAHRQPALLAQVYVSPTLLAQDVAQIQTRVPEGCVLVGLKTSYRQLRVISRTPTRIEVSGTITLSAAELRCAGQVRGRTSPAGPTPVRVVLSATPDGGFAIASQQIGVA